ncbi:Rz1-like lysis system protein LysC [Bordetella sp. H567]|uniref:Rz1-like lysis system protein LysC n=1 Tax=Bordetella sp. H567 TaxID=1697043 RepID=UPI0009770E71
MPPKNCKPGLISLCLTLLSGCASVQPSPDLPPIPSTCPIVSPCSLTASNPRTSGDLNLQLERAENDWAICAAVVDSIVKCQSEPADAKAR